LSLPVVLAGHTRLPWRLRRAFGAPCLDASREAIWLRLGACPGLRQATLNGAELAIAEWEVELGDRLAARNVLELEVDWEAARAAWPEAGWGVIELVILSQDAEAGPGTVGGDAVASL
jgi:hypothetical protein